MKFTKNKRILPTFLPHKLDNNPQPKNKKTKTTTHKPTTKEKTTTHQTKLTHRSTRTSHHKVLCKVFRIFHHAVNHRVEFFQEFGSLQPLVFCISDKGLYGIQYHRRGVAADHQIRSLGAIFQMFSAFRRIGSFFK